MHLLIVQIGQPVMHAVLKKYFKILQNLVHDVPNNHSNLKLAEVTKKNLIRIRVGGGGLVGIVAQFYGVSPKRNAENPI